MTTSLLPLGYHRQFLHIDLSTGAASFVPIPEKVLRSFIGGSGLGTWLLLHFGQAAESALAPAAPLIFALSPLVGSPLTTSAKFAVVSKSPLTNRINDSLASSRFALAAKGCGCDAIVLTGRASRPTIVVIDDGSVTLEDAGRHWGMDCTAAQKSLNAIYGPDFQPAVIGPAGENLVHFATISHAGRHAGRGGSGTVLGSKNIKALLVRGTKSCHWSAPDDLLELSRQLSAKSLGPSTAKYRELGTATNFLVFNRLNTLPTRNFQAGRFADAASLAPEALQSTRAKTRSSCVACTIGCTHIYNKHGMPQDDTDGVRVEYENLFSLGSLCGISDPDAVLSASKKCDELGMDTISAGGTIAFAMECVARGLLDAPWLKFSDPAAIDRALDLIATRTGLGDRLANGSRHLARDLGDNALSFAPQVKGLELPGYEPRTMQTLALGMAVGTRGADHNRSGAAEHDFSTRVDRRHLTTNAAALVIESEDKAALLDSLILCRFLRGAIDDLYQEGAGMLRAVTGWNMTPNELHQVAQRIITAKKLFNIRAGWAPNEDILPDRFFQDTLPDDPAAHLSRADFQQAVRRYNELRGWTTAGWITAEQITRLGLA